MRPTQAAQRMSPWSLWEDVDPHHLCAYPPKPFLLEKAQGTRVWTEDGRCLVDLGGANQGVAILGHAHPHVVQAITAQLARGIHVSQTVPTLERRGFLERLHELLPESLPASFLTNSGTEAVECAVKLAVNKTGRSGLVSAKGAFHGRSLGSLRLTHRPEYRSLAGSLVEGTSFVPFGDEEALKQAVTGDTAAVVLEPVQGEGGIHVADAAYLRAARDITLDAGALLVFDEIQTGLGRTGTFLACEQAGVVPDIVTTGKGLAGGLPMGACSVSEEVARSLPPGGHGSTYGGNPLACAAGSAVLDVLERERLWERAGKLGQRFLGRLRAIDDERVRAVRGLGLMVAVDLRVRGGPVLRSLEESGFLALSAGRTVVRFLPPLVIDEADLDAAVDAFVAALNGLDTPDLRVRGQAG